MINIKYSLNILLEKIYLLIDKNKTGNIWKKLEKNSSTYQNIETERPFGTFFPSLLQNILIFIGKNTCLKRGVFRNMYAKIIMSLSSNSLDISFRKCAYRIRKNDNNLIETGILLDTNYNSKDLDFLINGSKCDSNFIDIGSNIGLYSLPMALACSKGITIAIDANPMMASRLNLNKKLSKISNINMVSKAISDKKGYGTLKIRKNDIAIVALDENIDGIIEISTLSDILKNNKIDKIYGLKIDIEGHEDKALVPFLLNAPKEMLPEKIVIEHMNYQDYPGCKSAFTKLNYELMGYSKNNSFYQIKK